VEQEAVGELTGQGVGLLRVVLGAQGGHDQGLGFAAGEQG